MLLIFENFFRIVCHFIVVLLVVLNLLLLFGLYSVQFIAHICNSVVRGQVRVSSAVSQLLAPRILGSLLPHVRTIGGQLHVDVLDLRSKGISVQICL